MHHLFVIGLFLLRLTCLSVAAPRKVINQAPRVPIDAFFEEVKKMRVSTVVVFVFRLNPLSPKIHIQTLQTDLHTFLLRIVERIWFKIKAFSLW